MAIRVKPQPHQPDIAVIPDEEAALKFIEGAGKPKDDTAVAEAVPTEKPKDPPTMMIIRGVERDLMLALDAEAKRHRRSRAFMVKEILRKSLLGDIG